MRSHRNLMPETLGLPEHGTSMTAWQAQPHRPPRGRPVSSPHPGAFPALSPCFPLEQNSSPFRSESPSILSRVRVVLSPSQALFISRCHYSLLSRKNVPHPVISNRSQAPGRSVTVRNIRANAWGIMNTCSLKKKVCKSAKTPGLVAYIVRAIKNIWRSAGWDGSQKMSINSSQTPARKCDRRGRRILRPDPIRYANGR